MVKTQFIHEPDSLGLGYFSLIYDIGSSNEIPGNRGIPHFMEHLMCKTFDDMRSYLRRIGIDYNACTSDNKIIFYFYGLNESLDLVTQELYERLTNSSNLWTEEAFNNEKKVIIQEYKDCFSWQWM